MDEEKSIITNIISGISNNKLQAVKLLGLIVYTIMICHIFATNPGKIFTNYPTIMLILFFIATFYIFYNFFDHKKPNIPFINLSFEVIKGSIILICFTVIIFYYYKHDYSGNVKSNSTVDSSFNIYNTVSSTVYALSIVSFIFIILYLCLIITSIVYGKNIILDNKTSDLMMFINNENNILKIIKYLLFIGVIITFIVLIIVWIVNFSYDVQNKKMSSSFSFYFNVLINLFLIIVMFAIIFKIIAFSSFYQENLYVQLITNVVFYIPCLFISTIDSIIKLVPSLNLPKSGKYASRDGYGRGITNILSQVTMTDYILLILALILNGIYFTYPYIFGKISKQGGNLLINNPIYLNQQQTIDTYQSLNSGANYQSLDNANDNNDDNYNYNYALSFWVFLDATSPSMTQSNNNYTSILNYGNKPNILYKSSDNSIMIVMQNSDPFNSQSTYDLSNNGTTASNIDASNNSINLDASGNRIILIKKNILLQKWNNIIFNYSGGTLDIFYNGELIKSAINVVPFMNYDTLVVGENNGINGGICSLNYFNQSLNIQQVYYLYNLLKESTPPVYENSEENIINIAKEVPSSVNKNNIINYGNTISSTMKTIF